METTNTPLTYFGTLSDEERQQYTATLLLAIKHLDVLLPLQEKLSAKVRHLRNIVTGAQGMLDIAEEEVDDKYTNRFFQKKDAGGRDGE